MTRANPKFSLRAFARKLGLSPGGLTQVLSRKKRLSLSRAHEISKKLGLDSERADLFLDLVQIDSTSNLELKAELIKRINLKYGQKEAVYDLTVDQFKLISDWFGLAILEYLSIGRIQTSTSQISRYFNLSTNVVDLTLERLERLELIERSPEGLWKRVTDRLMVHAAQPNQAVRSYYSSVLEKVNESIQSQAPQEKVIGTEVFNFDPADLKKAQKITEEYFQQMLALSHKAKPSSHVYQLFVDFFRIGPNQLNGSKNKENVK